MDGPDTILNHAARHLPAQALVMAVRRGRYVEGGLRVAPAELIDSKGELVTIRQAMQARTLPSKKKTEDGALLGLGIALSYVSLSL